MFGKVKKWLGIEGVKVELILPEEVRRTDGMVKGKLRFYSMHAQTVTQIDLKMVERYSRGRDDERLVDDELGNSNPVMGGLVKISKWFSKVNSEFRIEVDAHTLGVALHPFDKKRIKVK